MRKTIQTRAEIGPDRVLRVPVPPEVPTGQVDVVVVVETEPGAVEAFYAERDKDEERREKSLARAAWSRTELEDVLSAFAAFNAPLHPTIDSQSVAADAGAGMLRHLNISSEQLRAERRDDDSRLDRKLGA